jgi:hypothetical protein
MPRRCEWEDTRSCPGSTKSSRRLLLLHQRHKSDPGSLNCTQLREVVSHQAVQCEVQGKPHWDELFDPGHQLHESQDDMQPDFSMKYVLSLRPHGMLGYALLFTVFYLAYALYITITKVRYCKPRSMVTANFKN